MPEDRAQFETEEIRGLARRYGARRVYRDGVGSWRFPPWLCPHCTSIAGPDTEALPDCPEKLARHGPVEA